MTDSNNAVGQPNNNGTIVDVGTITGWLIASRRGDSIAAKRLWDEYFEQLVSLARRLLGKRSRIASFDEEDVAASVLGEMFVNLPQGRHSDVENRHQLWSLLVVITVRKTAELARRENTLKRGGGNVALESEIEVAQSLSLDQLIGKNSASELSSFMSQQCRELLELLHSPELEQIAVWKLAGYTSEEIAAELHCTRVTVQRKLRLIREIWIAESGLSVSSGAGPSGTA